jgi:hypothetical protein
MNVLSLQLPENRVLHKQKQKKKKREVPSLHRAISHYSSCTGRSSENILCSSTQQWMEEALRKKERHDETQFTTKIDGETTSLGPSYFHSFPVPRLMPYYAETGRSRLLIA